MLVYGNKGAAYIVLQTGLEIYSKIFKIYIDIFKDI